MEYLVLVGSLGFSVSLLWFKGFKLRCRRREGEREDEGEGVSLNFIDGGEGGRFCGCRF